MSVERRNKRPSLVILILAILFCGSASAAAVLGISVGKQTERTFGAAADDLTGRQRIILAFQLNIDQDDLLNPVDPTGEPFDFAISPGESVRSIGSRLEDATLIRDAKAFQRYLVYRGYDKTIQAGKFRLSPAASAVEIAEVLQKSGNARIQLTIFAGWRLEEVAAAVAISGLNISTEEFLDRSKSGYWEFLPENAADFRSLEGLTFSGTYTVERSTKADTFIQEMVDKFFESLTPEMTTGFSEQGMSLQEAVTLASIVEREAVVESEMPLIASVFHNRLMVGMRLESDPTVQYALGYNSKQNSWWTNPLSLENLLVSSPYNTYQNIGLPPGPICNPGLNALTAVANPEQTDYYFFRASCDGSGTHQFAVTYEEHVSNACP